MTGTGNTGGFIDIGADGPGNPLGVNDGVQSPVIAATDAAGNRSAARGLSFTIVVR